MSGTRCAARLLWAGLLACALAPGLAASEKALTPEEARTFARLANEGVALHMAGRWLEAETAYRKALALHPDSESAQMNLATLYMAVWRYPEAEALFRSILARNPRCTDALVWLARCRFQDPDYAGAFRCLRSALEADPSSANGFAMLGFLLLRLDLYDWADRALARAAELEPGNDIAVLGRAHLLRLHQRYEDAARLLLRLLLRKPLNASAYQELGMTLSSMERTDDGLRVLDKGIAVNPYMPPLRSARGFLLFKLERVDEAVRAYREALRLDPDYAGGHGVFSFLPAAPRDASRTDRVRSWARQARAHLEAGRFDRAEALFRRILDRRPSDHGAWLGLGACRFADKDAHGVLAASYGALESCPASPLAHNLFLTGRRLLDERRKAEVGSVDYLGLFRALPAPAVEGVERVFTNFSSLDEDNRKVVLRSVHPLRRWLPELERRKVTHVVLPLNRHLTEVGGMREWRGKKTLDGRFYDAVRGVAGRGGLTLAITGVENLWSATYLEFNTLAHEFAHQVHIFAFGASEKKAVEMLFEKAGRRGTFLDYYSATDVWEYFAQGYEAFVSETKRPTVSEAQKNTRADLQRTDPALHAFLLSVTDE